MTKQPDGICRWTYELNMYRNPTVLITVLKVLGISMGLVWLFTVLISIGDRRFWWDGFLSETKVFALVMLGFVVLGAVSYYLYALIQGGRYCVLFEMDEQGVKHTQLARPFKVTLATNDELRRKRWRFAEETKTRRGLRTVLIAAEGVADGSYRGEFHTLVTGDDLFVDV